VPLAVTLMGRKPEQPQDRHSQLVVQWKYESRPRLVDLETVSVSIFALNILDFMCKPVSECMGVDDHFLVMDDRMRDWPRIFNEDMEWTRVITPPEVNVNKSGTKRTVSAKESGTKRKRGQMTVKESRQKGTVKTPKG
jgi:hypothetical protein